MFYAFLALLVLVLMLLGWEWVDRSRARRFAQRHGLRAVRGSIDTHSPLVGEIKGARVQWNPERVNVGQRARESRVLVTLEWSGRDIGILQRWKSGWVELSVQSPAGMQRVELSAPLSDEYELWGSASRQRPWAWLERPAIIQQLCGFRALRRVQCLGTSVTFVVKGDLGDVQNMERIWRLLDELAEKE